MDGQTDSLRAIVTDGVVTERQVLGQNNDRQTCFGTERWYILRILIILALQGIKQFYLHTENIFNKQDLWLKLIT